MNKWVENNINYTPFMHLSTVYGKFIVLHLGLYDYLIGEFHL